MKKTTNSYAYLKRLPMYLILILLMSCNTGPKTKEVELTYLVKEKPQYERIPGASLLGTKPRMKVWVTLTNTSDYAGVFKFYVDMSSQGNTIRLEADDYIPSGGQVTLQDEIEINPYSFETGIESSWGIIAPTKTVDIK